MVAGAVGAVAGAVLIGSRIEAVAGAVAVLIGSRREAVAVAGAVLIGSRIEAVAGAVAGAVLIGSRIAAVAVAVPPKEVVELSARRHRVSRTTTVTAPASAPVLEPLKTATARL
ncbi:hypothetical protein [Halorussus halobius]|uniref:hypothetical protein n=1 Tax=Halorussus halobius TaxID=1710537 RepID=UPI001B2FFDF5|nr:hypothetical protein [Halorussus halobius]